MRCLIATTSFSCGWSNGGRYRGCFREPLPAVSGRKRRSFFASIRSTVATPIIVSASVFNDSQPLFQSFSASVVQLVLCRESRSFGPEVSSACFSWRQFLSFFWHSKSCLIYTFIRQSSSVFHPSALSAQVIPEQSSGFKWRFTTTFANSSNFNCTTTHCQNMYVPQTTPQQCHNFLTNTCLYIFVYVDLNLLVGVMTFTFCPLHCFYATIVEGGAADRRRRPILVCHTSK